MKIHHIGYCVSDIDKSAAEFKKIGYTVYGPKYEDSCRKIYIQFMKNGETLIELVSPLGTGGSPVDGILQKVGSTPYHICYETSDIEDEIARLRQLKYVPVTGPEAAAAIDGNKVAFMFKRNVGLIELVEFK